MLTTVIAVLSTPVIVRLLGPGGYGDYAVLLSVFSLYMVPVSGTVGQGVQKFVAEHRDAPDWRESVLRFYVLLGVGIVAVAAALLALLTAVGLPAAVFGTGFTFYFYLLVAFVVVAQLRVLAYHSVLGFGFEGAAGALTATKKAVIVGLGIALLLAGFGIEGMLAGHIAANVLVALVGALVVARHVSVRALLRRTDDAFPRREVLSFNAFNVILGLTVLSLVHVDVIMLRAFAGSQATGFYKGALALAEYLWVAPMALETVLLHSSSTLWSQGRREEITALATRVTRYSVLLVGLLALGLAALADAFVPLYYGEAFAVATGPLLVLLPGAVGFAAARPLRAISQGSGRIKVLVAATGGAAALNLVLNAALIPTFGMYGAAAATSAGYGSMFGLLVWVAWRVGYDPLSDFRPARIAATALLAGPPISLLARAVESDVLALVVVPPVGLAVYSAAAILTGAIDAEEVHGLLGRVPDPVGSAIEAGFLWLQ